MENIPATNKSAKSARSSSSKAKKPKVAAKSSKAKTSQTNKVTTTSSTESAGITQQQRQTMIQEMAYLIAERRGFNDGNPTDDWLLAENQVDAKLLSGATEG